MGGNNNALTIRERDRIAALHAEGKSCNAIAKDLGRSASTISKAAKAAGLSFDASRTVPATENRVANNRAKRSKLEERLLDEAALLLDQLHQQHLVFNWSKDNDYAERLHDEPDVQAKVALVRGAGTAIDKALKLAEADKASDGAVAGKSMIGGLFEVLRITPVGDEPTEPEDTE